jgi:D-lactate dehydrogenase (cytochrome)
MFSAFFKKSFTILFDPNNPTELQNVKALNKIMIEEALKMGGTCTGEHGIGIGKKDYLQSEHGDSIFMMQLIKSALDPLNIFNPGKIFTYLSNQKKEETVYSYVSQQESRSIFQFSK